MNIKHTLAPWHISGTPTSYGREHIVADDGTCIATVHQPGPHPGRQDPRDVLWANSNLIGRAPNMYDALRVMADMRPDGHTNPEELLALCIAMAQIEIGKVERR